MVEGVLLHPRSFLRLGEFGLEPRDMVFGLGVHRKLLRVFGIPLRRGGVLGAVYRGEDELSELLCSIPYFAMVSRTVSLQVPLYLVRSELLKDGDGDRVPDSEW